MTVNEWLNDRIDECQIPLWKFLRIIHRYTERVDIYVVSGMEGFKDNVKDFWLTTDVFKEEKGGGQPELERILKYYADVPVWNVCSEWGHEYLPCAGKGRRAVTMLTSRCHYKDIQNAFKAEKADKRREQRREYDRKRRTMKNGTAGTD